MFFPFLLGDSEMFVEADSMASPVHIVPEWYFLFAYAILRAIPDKVLGVLALLRSILFFYLFYFVRRYQPLLNKFTKVFTFVFVFVAVLLSWLGQCLVEVPFLLLRGLFSFAYFALIAVLLFLYFLVGLLFESVFIIREIYRI